MKVRGLCIVKNESDIIEQTFRSAAEWCDRIYVFDNGSTDGTWEKVQALAQELPAVTPYKQDSRPFHDSIRGEILRHYAARAKRGDWWCILDADEFYFDSTRDFLKNVPREYKAVWMQLFVYRFTDKDLAAYQHDPNLYDDSVPIEQRMRYYVVSEYSTLRFFRHSKTLTHIPGRELRPIYPRPIRGKHFAYRSPDQIRRRLDTRREPMQRGEFLHEKRANWVPAGVIVPGPAQPEDLPQSWEERVTLSSNCFFDRRDGTYAEAGPWAPPENPAPARPRSRTRLFLKRVRRAKGRLLGSHSSAKAART